MKLFWKIFFSIMLITVSACSVESYFLITAQFDSGLTREITAAYEENNILQYTLKQELATWNNLQLTKEQMQKKLQTIKISISEEPILFRLSSQDGELIYSNCRQQSNPAFFDRMSENMRGYEIYQSGADCQIRAVSTVTIHDAVFFLENFRDISALFQTQTEQYQTFLAIIACLIAVVSIAAIFIAGFMLVPLRKVSLATKEIASGRLHQRLQISSEDEIGEFSRDFNQMAEQMEQMILKLQDFARKQEDFVHSFSHELKTPLTSIIGYADMLRSKKLAPERVIRSANYIFSKGKRLESLSMKLMELIILEKQDFPMVRVSAEEFFQRVEEAFSPIAQSEQIAFQVEAEAGILLIEPDLMKTVCLNLLDNARKAVLAGGTICLLGNLEEDAGYCIAVTDDGKGIPPEDLSRITEAFYMVDKSRARAQGGAGLGLSICTKIVELHQAELEFQSTVGIGTAALIHLKGGGGNEDA